MTPQRDLPQVTWRPDTNAAAGCQLSQFLRWVGGKHGVRIDDYRQAWEWSVAELSLFWDGVREYFDVIGDGFTGPALAEERMPGAVWYPGARLNFAENVLRYACRPDRADDTAVIDVAEDLTERRMSWRTIEARVAALGSAMRELGVGPGDRVAAVLPNVAEAVIAALAAASVGAIWAISSPEMSARTTLDRLGQLEPKLLIGSAAHRYNGKDVDSRAGLEHLRAALPSVEHSVLVRHGRPTAGEGGWLDFDTLSSGDAAPHYERVPFDHPLWVLFTSGTTGAPKGIVHGHGGIVLEAWKSVALNHDAGIDDVYFAAANTSWMVWNTLLMNLICGAAVVTYSGSPTHPRPDRLFEVTTQTNTTQFAVGAAYLARVQRAGLRPGTDWDLNSLQQILSTGSPLSDSTWEWTQREAGPDVHLGSVSGGTEICSSFLDSNPLEPVRLGQLQGPALGVAAQVWSEAGQPVVDTVGELVITRPMPSMPVMFWNDTDGARYRSAYFERFPAVWTHGDWVTETASGGFVVHGRSDATLNRSGVRLGSAEIYAALETVPEIADSLVVGVEEADGRYYMPLFVVLGPGAELDDVLEARIRHAIRTIASPRHLPDEIVAAPGVPLTHTNKRTEMLIKGVLAGRATEETVGSTAVANPDVLAWYVAFARDRQLAGDGASR
ncbi:acetoacetate--CoA ligase [Mycobacterium sp. GA-2829]|uniref:acetoacetate--CoA ligase n=1 Tax=Mycobacterium sp. GA-2829 TaxID=1772283 RepID=UPI00073FFBA9|nr:acetoacetate--CoA ligase [Mycobacterium sp. GA-2829]KUI26518.1 acetoacetyl-CoA synthetase [Mycobacterium sp. GA-2829]